MIANRIISSRAVTLALLVLMAMAIGLRGFAPLAVAEHREGLVAICTGSEIVYVPLADLGLGEGDNEDPETVSDPCSWYGFGAAVFHDPGTAVLRPVSRPLTPSAPVWCEPGLPAPAAFQSRAPPVHRI